MKTAEYLETEAGQRGRYRYRRLRAILADIDQPPSTKKGSNEAEKVAFQRKVLADLRVDGRKGRRPFKSPIVLDLRFDTNENAPPHIHQLAKNYLDLLGHPVFVPGTKRRQILYEDDSLVQTLFVKYNLEHVTRPSISIRATTLRDFAADLELINRIENGEFRAQRWHSLHHDPPKLLQSSDDDDTIDEHLQKLRQPRAAEKSRRSQFGDELFDNEWHFELQRTQESMLASTERFLLSALASHIGLSHSEAQGGNKFLLEFSTARRNLLLSPPFSIELAQLPRAHGDTVLFKTGVREAITQFKKANPFLCRLSHLVSLIVIVVPPKLPAGTKPMDLDNLARQIVPAVHDILEPPATFWRTVPDPGPNARPDIRKWYEDGRAAIKGLPSVQITSYSVFSLPQYRKTLLRVLPTSSSGMA